jgi:hypothetical protein
VKTPYLSIKKHPIFIHMLNNDSQPSAIGDLKDQAGNTSSSPSEKKLFVNKLALIIILLSGIILIILIIMAWRYIMKTEGADNPSFTNVKDLLTILLPLIGTWVGTILAFYFSKENFSAANQRVKELINQITPTDSNLQVLNAVDVMIKPLDASLLILDNEAVFKASKLIYLIGKMEESHSERLPILKANSLKFIFLIYRTTIERFLLGYRDKSIKLDPSRAIPVNDSDLTIDDMFTSDYKLIKDIISLNARQSFLPITATLCDVKKAMSDNDICQDIFITKTGNKEEAVEGWITNNMIIEKAELFKKSQN